MQSIVPVIVPVFDGVEKLSPSMKGFLEKNVPNLLMSEDQNSASDTRVNAAGGNAEVNIGCTKWWWHCNPDITKVSCASHDDGLSLPICQSADGSTAIYSQLHSATTTAQDHDDRLPGAEAGTAGTTSSKVIDFYFVPIVKRENHKKHNSHQWFFDSICMGLDNNIDHIFLTGSFRRWSFTSSID